MASVKAFTMDAIRENTERRNTTARGRIRIRVE